jgi:hypothetical protein
MVIYRYEREGEGELEGTERHSDAYMFEMPWGHACS